MSGIQQFLRANGANVPAPPVTKTFMSELWKESAEVQVQNGKGANSFNTRHKPFAIGFLQGELHFLHDGFAFIGNFHLDGEIGLGGLFARGDRHNDVGEFDIQSVDCRSAHQGGLRDFAAPMRLC